MKAAVEIRPPKVDLVFVHLRCNLLPSGFGHVKELEKTHTHTTPSLRRRPEQTVPSSHFQRYLWDEEQSQGDRDGHMGVCEGEQQHPVRMEGGKGEPGANTHTFIPHLHPSVERLGVTAYLRRWKVVERSSSLWMAMPMKRGSWKAEGTGLTAVHRELPQHRKSSSATAGEPHRSDSELFSCNAAHVECLRLL